MEVGLRTYADHKWLSTFGGSSGGLGGRLYGSLITTRTDCDVGSLLWSGITGLCDEFKVRVGMGW